MSMRCCVVTAISALFRSILLVFYVCGCRGFHSTDLDKVPCPGCAGFFGKIPQLREDDFPENRLRPDLAQPMGTRLTFVGGNGTPGLLHTVHIYSVMRWLPQLMCILPSLSCVRMSRLSMTDIVMSNSSKISDCSLTSPVLMNSFRRSLVSTSAI